MASNFDLFLILSIVFQFKHFISDFIFQNVWMLQKARPNWSFVLPLSVHCAIHSVGTLVIVLWVNPSHWWLALLDFVVHFVLDRIKAGPRYLGRFSDMKKSPFWICFGFDQMLHHLTHIYIAWYLVVY